MTTCRTSKSTSLSLHDALPIYRRHVVGDQERHVAAAGAGRLRLRRRPHRRLEHHVLGREPEDISAEGTSAPGDLDRKSTRLNSSHLVISYAVFCLKKKNIDKRK